MKMIVFVFLPFVSVLSMCVQKNATWGSAIEGNWYILGEDSSYQEAFFRNGQMWGYSEVSGPVVRNYSFEGDSIMFHDSRNVLVASFKVSFLESDQVILINRDLKVKYSRLFIDLNVDRVFKGDDNAIRGYVTEFRNRQSAMIESLERKK